MVSIARILWSINYPRLEVYIYEKQGDKYVYIDNIV